MARNYLPRPFQLLGPLFEQEEEWFPSLTFDHENGLSISEDESHVVVEAALPGLTPEEIEVSYQKGVLWIKGEKQEEEKDKKRKYYRKASQSYAYSVAIPGKIDETKEPQATFNKGVMEVKFNKAEPDTPRRIQIKSN